MRIPVGLEAQCARDHVFFVGAEMVRQTEAGGAKAQPSRNQHKRKYDYQPASRGRRIAQDTCLGGWMVHDYRARRRVFANHRHLLEQIPINTRTTPAAFGLRRFLPQLRGYQRSPRMTDAHRKPRLEMA